MDTIAKILAGGAFTRQQADVLRRLLSAFLGQGGGGGNGYFPGGWS